MNEIQKALTVGQLVKTSNQFARGRKVKVESLDASRTLATLIACIKSGDTVARVYEVNAAEIMRNEDGRSYAAIKKLCTTLAGAFVECERLGNRGPVYSCIPLFSKLEYEAGIISCEFNEKAAPHLFDLSAMFTTYRLAEFLSLGSRYAQTLFELLRSWSSQQDVTIPLEQLHKLTDAPVSARLNFAEFRRKVLDMAEKEIHEKTSLRYFWTPIRKGKKVTAIRFEFTEEAHGKPARLASSFVKPEPEDVHFISFEPVPQGEKDSQLKRIAAQCWKSCHGQCQSDKQPPAICGVCRKNSGKHSA